MYKIIGADGKEYGPITIEQLRQWVAEGRANMQTQVRLDGTTEWITVGDVPDIGGAAAPFVAGVPGIPAFPTAAPASASVVNGPATGLLCVAIIGFLAQVIGLIFNLGAGAAMMGHQANNPFAAMGSPVFSIIGGVIGILVSGFIVFGALKMKKLENHGLAMATSIIAMIPCISPCCIIGLPIGIWALVVLAKPEVKSAFH